MFNFKINTSPKGNIPISLVSTLMMNLNLMTGEIAIQVLAAQVLENMLN